MTTMPNIKEIMRTFVINQFLKESSDYLEDDVSFLEKGIIDSTGVLELVAFMEIEFKFRVEEDEIIPDNLDSVNKLVNYIQVKLAGKS